MWMPTAATYGHNSVYGLPLPLSVTKLVSGTLKISKGVRARTQSNDIVNGNDGDDYNDNTSRDAADATLSSSSLL